MAAIRETFVSAVAGHRQATSAIGALATVSTEALVRLSGSLAAIENIFDAVLKGLSTIKNDPVLLETLNLARFPDVEVERDVVVRMMPREHRQVRVHITDRGRAKPRIVEPRG